LRLFFDGRTVIDLYIGHIALYLLKDVEISVGYTIIYRMKQCCVYVYCLTKFISFGFQPWCVWTFSATPWKRSIMPRSAESGKYYCDPARRWSSSSWLSWWSMV